MDRSGRIQDAFAFAKRCGACIIRHPTRPRSQLVAGCHESRPDLRGCPCLGSTERTGQAAFFSLIPVNFSFAAKQVAAVLRGGIEICEALPVNDDIQRVRVMVYDRNSNSIGWLTIPVAKP
jgi:hypothetical protein